MTQLPAGDQVLDAMSQGYDGKIPPEPRKWDGRTLYDVEREQILLALEYFEGNKTQASVALGITIKTLYNKLHEYGLFEKYTDRRPYLARGVKR